MPTQSHAISLRTQLTPDTLLMQNGLAALTIQLERVKFGEFNQE